VLAMACVALVLSEGPVGAGRFITIVLVYLLLGAVAAMPVSLVVTLIAGAVMAVRAANQAVDEGTSIGLMAFIGHELMTHLRATWQTTRRWWRIFGVVLAAWFLWLYIRTPNEVSFGDNLLAVLVLLLVAVVFALAPALGMGLTRLLWRLFGLAFAWV